MSQHLIALTATEVVAGLAKTDFALDEVRSALRAHHAAVNRDINAFEFVAEDTNGDYAAPLHGLPITVKDQIAVAGMPLNHGLDRASRHIPSATAPVVQRLLDAGATVWGKTTLPPHAMDFQTFNSRTGITRNPWNLDRTAGGSSGGGAAAVAAGMSYLDIAADLSGSLRLPAAFCGVYSLMPTDSAVETRGLLPKGAVLDHFARPGCIARSVDDLELAWSLLRPEAKPATKPASYKIGCWDGSQQDLPVDDEIAAVFATATKELAAAGIAQANADSSVLFSGEAYASFGEIMGYETGGLMPAPVRMLARRSGKSQAERSPNFLHHVHNGYRRDKKMYQQAQDDRAALQESFESSWTGYDALLLPVCAVQPFAHQSPQSDRGGLRDYAAMFEIAGRQVGYFDALTAFTVPISLMGNPVVTIPLGLDSSGLPVGGQLVGRRGGEQALLNVAKRISSALPALRSPYVPA